MAVLYAGTYDKNGGHGLTAVSYSGEDGWRVGESFGGARNVSYGTFSPRFGLHYLVDEQSEGAVGVYRRSDARWQQLARIPSLGAEPCYVSLSASERQLAIANYASGSVTLVGLENGLPSDGRAVRHNEGHGPVADRQDGPHAHCALFGPADKWLYHVDLGTDEVLAYPFELARTALGPPQRAYKAPAGSGPRHLVFHPRQPLALLVSELAASLTLLAVDEPRLSARQTLQTAPRGYAGENLGGHLALNAAGDRVYVTNRGHDSIAVFALEDGELSVLQHVASGGASPRFFVMLEHERLLFLANEQGGNITAFHIEQDGTLRPLAGECALPGVVFLLADQST